MEKGLTVPAVRYLGLSQYSQNSSKNISASLDAPEITLSFSARLVF